MKIVQNLVQRTPEWHEFRAEGIGGSEIAAVLGMSPFKTPLQVFLEKTGAIDPPDLSKNPNVRRGIRYEDHIADVVLRHFGQVGTPLCGIHEEHPFLRVSFDMVTEKLIIEIKSPSDKQWDWVVENGPHPYYVVQVQYQMIVAEKLGLPGKLVYWREVENPDGTKREEVRIFDVTLEADRRLEIIEAARAFMDLLDRGVPPPADPERDVLTEGEMTDEQIEVWRAVAALSKKREGRYAKLKAIQAKLDKADEEDQKKLLDIIGVRFSGSGSGIRFTRFWKSGTVDYNKALSVLAPETKPSDLDPFRKKGNWQTRLTVEKPPKEKAVKKAA